MITGPLGSDRIDYLMRDAYHTGVAYGVIDYIRLMNKLAFSRDGNVAIYENGIDGAESMLIARYYMFSSVYLHHTTLISGAMYNLELENAIEEGSIIPEELVSFTDDKMVAELLKSNASNHIIEMVLYYVVIRVYPFAFYRIAHLLYLYMLFAYFPIISALE